MTSIPRPVTAASLSVTPPQRALRRWKGHTDAVTDVEPSPPFAAPSSSPSSPAAFLPSLLASTSADCTTRIWQLPSSLTAAATTVRCLRYKANGALQPVSCCAWHTPLTDASSSSSSSSSRPTLFTAHSRCVAVWDLHSCSEHALPLVCTQPTQLLPIPADEERKESQEKEEKEEEEDEINQLLLSDDGSLLAACDDSGRWYSWRITYSTVASTAASAVSSSSCPPSLSFHRLGSLHSAHSNLCSALAFLPPLPAPASSPLPLVLSAGFDYQLLLSTADGTQRLRRWNVNEWTDEQRRQLEEAERVAAAGTSPEKRPPSTRPAAPRKGQTAAERLREKIKQKQTSCTVAPAAASLPPPPSSAAASLSSSSPLTNPPFPHCLAASPHSLSVLVGLGNGQLCLLSPLSSDEPAPLLLDAHAHAVVAVAWVGRSLISGNEYWLSAGSDKTIAVWRDRGGKGEAKREERVKDRGAGVAACGPVNGVDGLDRLVAVGLQGDVARLCCVWSVAHGWKVNSVSCQSSAAGIAVYVADVSHRVAVYRVT